MSQKFKTGIAIAVALAVITLFFIFNPFTLMQNSPPAITGAQLILQDEAVGTGAEAKPGDTLLVNYTGKLQDGTVFDTSVGARPISFVLGAGEVIPGWDQGLQGMKVGGKRLLVIPPDLAFGAQGNGPVPANATLVFEVELLDIKAGSGVQQ